MTSVGARAVVGLARIEAWQSARSVLVLAGLAGGGLLVWTVALGTQPLWWNGGWAIGYGQTVISTTVLIAAQLATGRAHRDGLAQLYDSFPSSAGRRTLAHLVGLLGALPACLILIGVVTGVFEAQGVLGTPDLAALVGGVLLVLAGGAIGVAIGVRFRHPLAGVLGGFVWFIPFSQSNRWTGSITWVFPWVKPDQLAGLPGPLAGYPPASAHAVELAAIAVLAGVLALAVAVAGRRSRAGLLAVAAAALAAIVVAGGVQSRPIPTQTLDDLVSQAAGAGSQHCATSGEVRYCLFPEFDSKTASLQGPIDAALAHVPAQGARTLTISQFSGLAADDPTLTHGHSAQQVAAWGAQLRNSPSNLPSSTTVYVNPGAWPTGGQQAAAARFDLAFGAAEWAVGLPTNSGATTTTTAGALSPQCVPLNQAREAVAVWLAAQAVELPSSPFQTIARGLNSGEFAQVNGTVILTWTYPGEEQEGGDYLASPGVQTTAAGYLLAQAMTKLPTTRVASVLSADWASWTSPRTTDAQLAAALGIAMPAVPSAPSGPSGQVLTVPSNMVPPQPECTS
jgi:hypothetical protein